MRILTKVFLQKLNTRTTFILLFPIVYFYIHCIHLYNDLIFNFSTSALFILYICGTYLIFIFLLLIQFSVEKAALISLIVICNFIFYGIIQDFLISLDISSFISNSFFLIIILIAISILIYKLFNKRKDLIEKLIRYFIVLFSILSVFELFQILIFYKKNKNVNKLVGKMIQKIDFPYQSHNSNDPDIHYIIFDSYTNSSALKSNWDYDNDIKMYLDSKGFFSADSSRSNYLSTPFSISSILNLQYLQSAQPFLASNSYNFLIGRKSYINNQLYQFLNNREYQFSIFSQLEDEKQLTTFGFLGVESPATWIRKLTIERLHLNPWVAEKITRLIRAKGQLPLQVRRSMKSFITYNFKAISHFDTIHKMTYGIKNRKPIFTFTHIMLPHDPYQVDEHGNLINSAQPGGNDMKGYLRQVKYSNKLIKTIVDKLLADSTQKKIILIQGDHGYRHYSNPALGQMHDAFCAIYFYNKDYKDISQNMTLVNTFRIVVNKFFEGQLPMLKDTLFK